MSIQKSEADRTLVRLCAKWARRCRITALVFVLGWAGEAAAATVITRKSDSDGTLNWSAKDTWLTQKTGTITSITFDSGAGTYRVVGSGTLFTTELVAGDVICPWGDPHSWWGAVSHITDATHLEINSPNYTGGTGVSYGKEIVPTSADDVTIGNSLVNGSVTITFDVASATVNSLTFASLGYAMTLWQQSNTLTVNGNVTINQPTVSVVNWWKVGENGGGTGTATVGGNLTIGSGDTTVARVAKVTIGAGTLTVNGILAFSAGGSATAAAVFDATGNGTLNLKGNFTKTVGTFTPAQGTVNLNGTSAQTINSGPTFYNLTINNSANISISANVTVNNTLTMTSGDIGTGANTLIVASTSSSAISGGSASSYVNGNLQKAFTTGSGQSFTFPIGDASNYTPINLASATVGTAGNLTAKTTTGQHPNIGTSGINSSKDVARYWTLTSGGGFASSTYSATFNFVAGDVIGGASTGNFIIQKYSSGWTSPTVGTKTSTSTQATGLNAFGDFAVGESVPVPTKLAYTVVPGTGTAGTAFSVTVQSQNASGTPVNPTSATTITLSKATGSGTLSGTLTGTIPTSGNSVTISTPVYSKADTMTLTATPTAGMTGLTPVTSGNIVFSAGTATKLAYTTVPSTGTAGTAFSVTVQSQDANGNPANLGSATTITLSKATGGGTLSGTLTGSIGVRS